MVTKDKQTFMCEICDKLLSSSATRKRHLKCVHGLKLPPVISNSDNNKTCDLCNKTFSSKFAKERHTSEVHDSMRTECSKPTAVQCKECGVNFSRLSIYRQHLQQFHNIETTTAQYEFASEEEFMAWKDALEMEVGVNYTSHTGNKKSVDSTKTIYYCRRSGVQKSSKSTHKRAEKSQGTSKMGYYCTSSIEAVRQNGCVQVTYYVEHHEHDIDFHSLVHMTLPNSPSEEIEYIQDIVCNKLSTDSQPQNYGEQLIKYIYSNLLPQCKEISDQEAFKAAGDHIRKAVAILSAAKNLASSNCMLPVDLATKKEPANKHCDKQQKLYSTKRKRVDTGQGLTKPSKEMRQKIGERLSDLSQMPVPMNSPPGDSQY